MGDISPMHALVVIFEPGHHDDPVRVTQPIGGMDPLTPADAVAVLRLAAMRLAREHGVNGADALRDLIAHHPHLQNGDPDHG